MEMFSDRRREKNERGSLRGVVLRLGWVRLGQVRSGRFKLNELR